MSSVALVAAKGSPGVTTTALALAAAAGSHQQDGMSSRPMVLEADPAGGDLECWCGPLGEPGLVQLAAIGADSGNGNGAGLGSLAVKIGPGVQAVTAPTAAGPMAATLSAGAERLAMAVESWPGTVFLDCGRWISPGDTLASIASIRRLVIEADVVLVVCRPSLASVEHARWLLGELRARNGREGRLTAAVVLGGDRPYGPQEIAASLGVPVVGVLPWDPRGVTALLESGATQPWLRSALAAAAVDCLRTPGLSPTGAVENSHKKGWRRVRSLWA